MESLRPKGAQLDFMNRKWELVLNVISIDDIQDHFDIHIDQFREVLDVERRDFYNNVSYIITSLINEQIDISNENSEEKEPLYDLETVKRHINNMNIFKCMGAIISAYSLSWMKAKEGESPNV